MVLLLMELFAFSKHNAKKCRGGGERCILVRLFDFVFTLLSTVSSYLTGSFHSLANKVNCSLRSQLALLVEYVSNLHNFITSYHLKYLTSCLSYSCSTKARY